MADASSGNTLSVEARQNIRYPSPFFDVAQTYMPRNIRELNKWCVTYWAKNEIVNASIQKLAVYPITNIIVESEDDSLRTEYQRIFIKKLKLKKVLKEIGLDYYAMGNCFISIYLPFRRWLYCKTCGAGLEARYAKYTWQNYEFVLRCDRCGVKGPATVKDKREMRLDDVHIVRWNPLNIQIDHNEVTGRSTYKYVLNKELKSDIQEGTKYIIEETPWVFLEAAKNDAAVVLEKGNIYHLARPNISVDNHGWGFPIILPVLHALFCRQLLIKASEVMAQQHIVPLWVIFPSAQGEASPYSHMNLGNWRNRVETEIKKWKRDPNYIPIMPLPLGFQFLGGDDKLPTIQNEVEAYDRRILAGMSVPYEFVFGGVSFSGGSIGLRVLENVFSDYREDIMDMVNSFLVPTVAKYLRHKKTANIRLSKLKMADDIQQKQNAINLNAANRISDGTLLDEFGFDKEKEYDRMVSELKQRDEMNRQRMIDTAKAEGEAQLAAMPFQEQVQVRQAITKMQIQAMAMAQQVQEGQIPPPPGSEEMVAETQRMGTKGDPNFLDDRTREGLEVPDGYAPVNLDKSFSIWAEKVKELPREARESMLSSLKNSSPDVHAMLTEKIQDGSGTKADMRKQPEQKPPRRKKTSV